MNYGAAQAKYPMAVDDVPKDPLPDIKPTWVLWTAYYLGLLDMPHQPRIWGWNPSVIVLLLLIAFMMAGGGYYVGHQNAVIEHIQKQTDAAQQKADNALTIASGSLAEPEPTPSPKRSK